MSAIKTRIIDEAEEIQPSKAKKIKSIVLDKKEENLGINPAVETEPRLKPLHMAEQETGEAAGKWVGEKVGNVLNRPGQWKTKNEKGEEETAILQGIGAAGSNVADEIHKGVRSAGDAIGLTPKAKETLGKGADIAHDTVNALEKGVGTGIKASGAPAVVKGVTEPIVGTPSKKTSDDITNAGTAVNFFTGGQNKAAKTAGLAALGSELTRKDTDPEKLGSAGIVAATSFNVDPKLAKKPWAKALATGWEAVRKPVNRITGGESLIPPKKDAPAAEQPTQPQPAEPPKPRSAISPEPYSRRP